MKKCEFCGRETMKRFCCEAHRHYVWRKKKREEMKKEHRCIDCGRKLCPVFYTRCSKHLKKNRENKRGEQDE